jgi:hypothetical protein
MFFTLVGPEVLMGAALADIVSARVSEKEMDKWKNRDGVDWT